MIARRAVAVSAGAFLLFGCDNSAAEDRARDDLTKKTIAAICTPLGVKKAVAMEELIEAAELLRDLGIESPDTAGGWVDQVAHNTTVNDCRKAGYPPPGTAEREEKLRFAIPPPPPGFEIER